MLRKLAPLLLTLVVAPAFAQPSMVGKRFGKLPPKAKVRKVKTLTLNRVK
jgi:hypothetical protein